MVDTVLIVRGQDCSPKQSTSIAVAWQNTCLSPLMYNLQQQQQLFVPFLDFLQYIPVIMFMNNYNRVLTALNKTING